MTYYAQSSGTRTIALLVCLASVVAVTRVVLAGGPPNVKPAAFLSVFGGIIGGPMFGFAVGFLGIAVSDLFFGVGPWTLITSCCMGIIGFLGGFIDCDTSRVGLAIRGFMYTALYDILASLLFAVIFGYSWWISIAALYVPFLMGSVYPFGLIHELTTAFLFALAGPPLIRQSVRVMSR
jgi:energy-coupling factor transport system substrate-specific component